ncbi:MAG TPA: hypothetical protein VM754_06810 [Actinomycetota bacterium]|nr:hypothetical protein [Actinomycetota bacterium]
MKWLLRLLGIESSPQPGESKELTVKERRAEPDPVALAAAASGEPRPKPGLDLERLKALPSSAYQPLTEYLTYIQVKRGETESLVFVRASDIDALAALTGESRDNFVKEFKRLGVLISMN